MSNTLPANISNFLTAAKQTLATSTDDMSFIKMDKTGNWVHGSDDLDVEVDSLWAVNHETLSKGFAAWGDGELEGEEMATITQAAIIKSDLPDVGAAWKPQIGFGMQCIEGVDKGLNVSYSSTSKGASKAFTKLLKAIVARADAGHAEIIAVVTLDSTSYKHPKYGKVFTPVFTIEDWVDSVVAVAVEPVEETEPEPALVVAEPVEEPAAKTAPKRRRRSRAA
jgi:hypothetical protein